MSESEMKIVSEDAAISDLNMLTSDLTLSNKDTVPKEESMKSKELKPSHDDLLAESFEWLPNQRKDKLTCKLLSSWMVLGERKCEFDENTKFGNKDVAKKLYLALKELDGLTENELRKYRTRVNPLEMVKRGFLLNRSSIKFANIDSLMDYMFSNPLDKRNHTLIQPNELLYFVDINGGPGGFVDYLLWRSDWQTRGFGFCMKGYDYRHRNFTAGAQRFSIFNGANRDGDVTNEENIVSFDRYVKQHVPTGVHVVIADGAFNITERKYAKETLYKRHHLGEVIMALSVLLPNGHFILKLFDIFLPFTVGLVYLMHQCFAEICLIKPKTCRPSNAERYLICKWKNLNAEIIKSHLLEVNKTMHHLVNTKTDVIELVPEDVLLGDTDFYNFICKSNNLIAEIQVDANLKMIELTNDSNEENDQVTDALLVEKCLLRWNVVPKTIENTLVCAFDEWTTTFVDTSDNALSAQLPLSESFNLPGNKLTDEWHFIPIGNIYNRERSFFAIASASTNVMMYNRLNSDWVDALDIGLDFPDNTFLYGEIVYHYGSQREGKKPMQPHGFHIIDGLILNGQDIRNKPYLSRRELCNKFADTINNPLRYVKNRNGEYIPSASIYCKESFPLTDVVSYIEQFRNSWKTLPNGPKVLGLDVRSFIGPKRFYQVDGLLFFRHYPKIFDDTNFKETFNCRQLWSWDRPHEILNTVEMNKTPKNGYVYLSHFCDYLNLDMKNCRLNSSRSSRGRGIPPSRYSNNRGRGNRGFRR